LPEIQTLLRILQRPVRIPAGPSFGNFCLLPWGLS